MASIRGIAAVSPSNKYSREQILAAAHCWLQENPDRHDVFERLVDSARIETRCFSLTMDEILALPGAEERARLFHERGTPLAAAAVRQLLSECRVDPDSIGGIIFSSCSAPVIPSIDGLLVDALELPRTVRRIPIFQHGCAGGIIGLELAETFCRDRERVLVVSAELCSLGYHRSDLGGASILGAVLFGDGAAAALVEPGKSGLAYVDSQSYLLPDSRHVMGYDIFDDGMHLRLDSCLPNLVAEAGPKFIRTFLERSGLSPKDVGFWLFHPGGVKILRGLEAGLNLRPEQTHWAWDVLADCGNMSSATILFVAERFLREKPYQSGDYVCLMGIGPGLTAEAVLLQAM